jgi:hypothetical protein
VAVGQARITSSQTGTLCGCHRLQVRQVRGKRQASAQPGAPVFMFSIQIASTGPSNMIHFLSGVVSCSSAASRQS